MEAGRPDVEEEAVLVLRLVEDAWEDDVSDVRLRGNSAELEGCDGA